MVYVLTLWTHLGVYVLTLWINLGGLRLNIVDSFVDSFGWSTS